jgi:hypothetical protein
LPRNLVFVHLESISRQTLSTLGTSFPNIRRVLDASLAFENYFSSATSTLMVLTYLWHGNDFELDHLPSLEGARPAGCDSNLFSVLAGHGYATGLLVFDAFHDQRGTQVGIWPPELPPVWGTDDPRALVARFAEQIARPPFALYVWNLITHIEHTGVFAGEAQGVTDQVRRACVAADWAVGEVMAALERAGRLEDTVVVLFGDHGDDFWTHGFKAGMLHGAEPYTDVTWTPLGILGPGLGAGVREGLASTIDLKRTSLGLLGIDTPAGFAHGGIDLLRAHNEVVFSQNFTATQADAHASRILRAFAAMDDTYSVVASSAGLEMYAYRLDPGNHCNLLHLFALERDGTLRLRPLDGVRHHFRAAMTAPPHALPHLAQRFAALRDRLRERLELRRASLAARGLPASGTLVPEALDRVRERGRRDFFFEESAVAWAPPTMKFRIG